MSLVAELESLVEKVVDKRMKKLETKLHKPWILMPAVCDRLEKESRWVASRFCTQQFIELELVKKIGGEWHFKNPDFLIYVHDVWWPEQK